MPQITSNPAILNAAKSAIEQLLRFKGFDVELFPSRADPISKPSGGQDFQGAALRPSQRLALTQTGDDLVSEAETDGQQYITRTYTGTMRFDAVVAVGDSWSDDAVEYKVDTVDSTSGYKTSIDVIGFVKSGS